MPLAAYDPQVDLGEYYLFDDFVGSSYDPRKWGVGGGTGGSVVKQAAIGGQVLVTVSDVTGRDYYLATTGRNFNTSSPSSIAWRVKFVNYTYTAAQFGWNNGAQNIVLCTDTSSSYWLAQCRDGSGTSRVTTSKLLANAVWVELGIMASSGSVSFFVDGEAVATITTNIPTVNLGPIIYLLRQTGGSGTRSVYADWVEAYGWRTE